MVYKNGCCVSEFSDSILRVLHSLTENFWKALLGSATTCNRHPKWILFSLSLVYKGFLLVPLRQNAPSGGWSYGCDVMS